MLKGLCEYPFYTYHDSLPGHQIEEASDASNHFHGRQHQDPLCWLGLHSEGALQPTVGQDYSQRPVWILSLYCSLRQGQQSRILFIFLTDDTFNLFRLCDEYFSFGEPEFDYKK